MTLIEAIRTNNIPVSETASATIYRTLAVSNMGTANFYTHTEPDGAQYEVERNGRWFLVNRKIRTP